jgi:hypothetical protein
MNAPAAFIHPCRPIFVAQPPTGPGWAHELKHDGYRLQIHIRDGRVRLYTITGADWSKRYPLIGEDFRYEPFSERKAVLRKVLSRGIQYVEHTDGHAIQSEPDDLGIKNCIAVDLGSSLRRVAQSNARCLHLHHCPYVKAAIGRIVEGAKALRAIGIGTIARPRSLPKPTCRLLGAIPADRK